jgi:pimeloyl-ACP methyl ester carboxylesterase
MVTSLYPHRVTSVVLGATWGMPDERFQRVFGLRRHVLSALGTDAYALLGSILIAPSNETLDAIKPDLTNSGIIKARIDALLNYHGIEYLRGIRCRALVLAAADDVLIPLHLSRAVAAGIAGAELKFCRWAATASRAAGRMTIIVSSVNSCRTMQRANLTHPSLQAAKETGYEQLCQRTRDGARPGRW